MEEKKSYEIGYLIRSEEAKEVILGHLARAGALILSDGEIKGIKLAYPIEHLPSAYFGYIHFEIDPDSIAPLVGALRLDSQIVRALVITPPFLRERGLEPRSSAKVESTAASRGGEPRPDRLGREEDRAASNDLLEEKLEEILNK